MPIVYLLEGIGGLVIVGLIAYGALSLLRYLKNKS